MPEFTGRVMQVRRKPDGSYGVLVGPPPVFYWFVCYTPPRLGALLKILGEVTREADSTHGKYFVLENVRYWVKSEPWARREVAPEWLARVREVSARPLYDFQAEGAGWLASRLHTFAGAILADEPGLGKTTQTVAAILACPEALPALIVSPKSTLENWQREVAAIVRPDWHVPSEVIGPGAIPINAAVCITNYEQLAKREAQFLSCPFKTIVLDEAHLAKNAKASLKHRAAVVTRIAHRIPRRVCLTGSPVLNHPLELWRLLHIIDPAEWSSWRDFSDHYCTPPPREEGRPDVETAAGSISNLEELHVRTAPYILRRLKQHVLHELPVKRTKVLSAQLAPYDMQAYNEVKKDVIAWLKKVGAEIKTKKKTLAITKFTTLRRIAAMGKVRFAFPEFLKVWNEKVGRPLVVFAYHKDVVAAALAAARRVGCSAVSLTAAHKRQERQAIVDAFSRAEFMVLCCSIGVGGVGINLQRSCRDLMFLERLFQPPIMAQAEDRIHRIGQKFPVTIYYLDAAGTIDQHLARILMDKQPLIDHAIGDAEIIQQVARGFR